MAWNWQQQDWPKFRWDAQKLLQAEARFLESAGVIVGTTRHLNGQESRDISIEILSHEAVDSSAIEGERLDRESVQSSIRRNLGLSTDNRRVEAGEAGIAELMVNLYQNLHHPLTEATLCAWHGLIMNGRRDVATIGNYRLHPEPMQIVSGALYDPKVHYEAPPSDRVPEEMAQFLLWVGKTHPLRTEPLPAITRAGIAHLWFETIHPFEDGNGRIGRAIIEKILAQGLSKPAITGVAGTLLLHRKDYYRQLESASRSLDITTWLIWFADRVLEAQNRTLVQVEFIVAKSKLMDRVRSQINARQEKVLLRLFAAGPDGFVGGLSAANYMRITDATSATTTRDLESLVEIGALRRVGARKATRYTLVLTEAVVSTI